jgi:tetratricopeptide (TPR) repeat protein
VISIQSQLQPAETGLQIIRDLLDVIRRLLHENFSHPTDSVISQLADLEVSVRALGTRGVKDGMSTEAKHNREGEALAKLTSVNNMANVLSSQGKYEQAEDKYRQALRLCEKMLGKEHPDTVISMNNLAEMLYRQGKYGQAEAIHRQALSVREATLGKEHPDTLTSINNLATVLRDQGKYEQAEEIHRQALGLYKTVLGKEYPLTLTSMNNLAIVLSVKQVVNMPNCGSWNSIPNRRTVPFLISCKLLFCIPPE